MSTETHNTSNKNSHKNNYGYVSKKMFEQYFAKLFCNFTLADKLLNEEFIAIDTETTGLSPSKDRIVEISAVKFRSGKIVNSFNTLIHSSVPISSSATQVSHITNEMLIDAPSEKEAIRQFITYLGDAAEGKIWLCAHNVDFDSKFIMQSMLRLHRAPTLLYVDTLELAKEILTLPNYKQETIANYYNIEYNTRHRATDDATVCGKILINMLKEMFTNKKYFQQKWDYQKIKRTPSGFAAEVCKYVYNILSDNYPNSKNISHIRFRKRGSKMEILLWSTIAEIYIKKNEYYFIIQQYIPELITFNVEPCTNATEGIANARYYFTQLKDINVLKKYLCTMYEIRSESYGEDFSSLPKLSKDSFWEFQDYYPSINELL